MITALRCFYVLVLLAMLVIIVIASADRGLGDAFAALGSDPWVQATLMDAYFGFLTIWLWMAYKEPTWPRRLVWLVAVLLTGNVAIAVYMLWQLARLRPGDGIEQLLLRRASTHAGESVPC